VLAEQGGLASTAEKRRELRKDLLPALGACRPDQVKPEDIDRVARSVSERGAPAQARRLIMHVKSLYNYVLLDRPALAQKYGVVSNPAATLARRRTASAAYPASAPRKRVLSDAELAAVWPALGAGAMAPRTRLVLQLTLATAQRHGEVRQIQPRHLALDGHAPMWVIPRLCTKTKLHDHAVPLSPLAVALLREALALHTGEPTDWLFPAPGNGKHRLEKTVPATALAHFRRTRLPAIEPFTPHDLRRTAATGMRRVGVPGEIVKLILNHVRHDVTGRHYDLYEALPERRHALSLWARHIEQLASA
jgi:integrase